MTSITNWPQCSYGSICLLWWQGWSSQLCSMLFYSGHEMRRLIQLPHSICRSSWLVRWHIPAGSICDRLVLIGTEVSVRLAALSLNSYSINLIVSAAYESEWSQETGHTTSPVGFSVPLTPLGSLGVIYSWFCHLHNFSWYSRSGRSSTFTYKRSGLRHHWHCNASVVFVQ